MASVDILTIHFGINHGSVLQCYALSNTLADMGADVQVIDYVPARYRMWNNVKIKFPDKSLPWKLAYFLASSLIRFPQKLIFRRYLKRHIPLTNRYSDKYELMRCRPEADAYIVGSDQVWNSTYNGSADDSYFLPFAPEQAVKASYAASIGRDYLDERENEKFREALSSFISISVRESKARDLLKEAGVASRIDLDPVFLFRVDRWRELASQKKYADRYLLVYVIAQNYKDMLVQARQIADLLGLKLYVLSVKPIPFDGVDCNFIFSNPSDFLNLFDHAEFIVSNSFHGTAFSIIFGKRFLTYVARYNSRIENILDFTGLRDRLVSDCFTSRQIVNPIDYQSVHALIESATEESLEYLSSILGAIHND